MRRFRSSTCCLLHLGGVVGSLPIFMRDVLDQAIRGAGVTLWGVPAHAPSRGRPLPILLPSVTAGVNALYQDFQRASALCWDYCKGNWLRLALVVQLADNRTLLRGRCGCSAAARLAMALLEALLASEAWKGAGEHRSPGSLPAALLRPKLLGLLSLSPWYWWQGLAGW